MSYYDPEYVHWGPVVTINDDRTKPGFITTHHEHSGLDILNYMIDGECRHVDDLGNDNTARPGQIQHFWCGPSIWHTLSNESQNPARYLQIWIQPNWPRSDAPEYRLIDHGTTFAQIDVPLRNSRLRIRAGITSQPFDTDWSYVLVLSGKATIDRVKLLEGDSVETNEVSTIVPDGDAHFIVFDLN